MYHWWAQFFGAAFFTADEERGAADEERGAADEEPRLLFLEWRLLFLHFLQSTTKNNGLPGPSLNFSGPTNTSHDPDWHVCCHNRWFS